MDSDVDVNEIEIEVEISADDAAFLESAAFAMDLDPNELIEELVIDGLKQMKGDDQMKAEIFEALKANRNELKVWPMPTPTIH